MKETLAWEEGGKARNAQRKIGLKFKPSQKPKETTKPNKNHPTPKTPPQTKKTTLKAHVYMNMSSGEYLTYIVCARSFP